METSSSPEISIPNVTFYLVRFAGAFSDKSGHLVWLSAHNSGGVPHYPPNFREGLVSNFLLSLPFVGELHSVEAHAVRTSDLWRFVQNGDSFVPINGWNNDRMCLFSKECRGFCQTWWYTRVGRCAGGSAPSPSPPGTQPVQAVCQPEIYKIPTDGCQVTVLVDDVDAGSTVCAEKQISSTSFTGLQDQVVTLTVSLGTQVDTCTTVVKIQWEAPVLFCNETMTVSATSTGRSPFIEPEHLGFGFDPNGVARVVSFVGAEGGVPTDAYEKLLALYQEANATSNFREFYEIQAPALAAEYNLTDLYSDLTGVDLSANATGELNVGTYSITLTAQENTCLQTTSCVTPVTVVPFISTAAPTPNVRMPFKRPRYRPRVVDPKGKCALHWTCYVAGLILTTQLFSYPQEKETIGTRTKECGKEHGRKE